MTKQENKIIKKLISTNLKLIKIIEKLSDISFDDIDEDFLDDIYFEDDLEDL